MKWRIMQIDEALRIGPSEICIISYFFVFTKLVRNLWQARQYLLISANFLQIWTTIAGYEELKSIRNNNNQFCLLFQVSRRLYRLCKEAEVVCAPLRKKEAVIPLTVE